MAYEKKISRAEPGLIGLVLDDSGSMGDVLPGTSDAKCLWVERYTGIIFKELLARSTEVKGDQVEVKPRYYLHAVLYGSAPSLWGDECMDIQTAVEKYTAGGNSFGFCGNRGGTDTAVAFELLRQFLERPVADDRFKNSFPPLVFHLSDGMSATDATSIADEIKRLWTADGKVVILNAFIGTETSLNYSGPEDFPGYVDTSEAGPNEDNLRLYEMSSEVPESMRANLVEDGIFPNLRQGARLFFDIRTKEMLKHAIGTVGSLGSRADRMVR